MTTAGITMMISNVIFRAFFGKLDAFAWMVFAIGAVMTLGGAIREARR